MPNEPSLPNGTCSFESPIGADGMEVANPGENDTSWSRDFLGVNSPNICPPKWGTCLHVSRFVFLVAGRLAL